LAYQFGINLAVANDSTVDRIVEHLAYSVSGIYCIGHFQPKRVGDPMHQWNSFVS